MPRRVEEPKTVHSPMSPSDDNMKSTHPAFGQIQVSKIQGSRVLYGSDFVHHGSVRIAIHKSEHNRNLSHDWYFPKETLVEVEMSEAQWATFVSSFNMGSGVPCTLQYVMGESMPGLPDPDLKREFPEEVRATILDSVRSLKNFKRILDEEIVKLPKKTKEALTGPVVKAIQELECNLPFVKESFDKHMETSIEKAKVEIHAYVNNVLVHAGLQHLQGQALQLEHKEVDGRNGPEEG